MKDEVGGTRLSALETLFHENLKLSRRVTELEKKIALIQAFIKTIGDAK